MTGYRSITPEEVKKSLDSGEKVFVIDVRTPGEYAQKHIPGSLSIPLDRLEQEAAGKIPDKTVPIVVYCLSGGRSAQGAKVLVKLGYATVYNLGAITNWPYETETGSKK